MQVTNTNLFRAGEERALPELIQTKFDPTENWLPPGFISSNETRTHQVRCARNVFSRQNAIMCAFCSRCMTKL